PYTTLFRSSWPAGPGRAPTGSSSPSGSTAAWPTSTGSRPGRSPAPGRTCGDEPGRALPADAGAGPGLLGARPGDDDGAVVLPRPALRPAVAGHPPGAGRRVGPGPVAVLLRRRPLRRLPLPRLHRPLPGGGPAAGTHRRPVGAAHRHLAPRLRPLPPRRARH